MALAPSPPPPRPDPPPPRTCAPGGGWWGGGGGWKTAALWYAIICLYEQHTCSSNISADSTKLIFYGLSRILNYSMKLIFTKEAQLYILCFSFKNTFVFLPSFFLSLPYFYCNFLYIPGVLKSEFFNAAISPEQ